VIYLLHFSQKLHHAQHYLGYTRNVKKRVAQHLRGEGSPLVKAVVAAGIEVSLAWTAEGDRNDERRYKNAKRLSQFCPQCRYRGRHGEKGETKSE